MFVYFQRHGGPFWTAQLWKETKISAEPQWDLPTLRGWGGVKFNFFDIVIAILIFYVCGNYHTCVVIPTHIKN